MICIECKKDKLRRQMSQSHIHEGCCKDCVSRGAKQRRENVPRKLLHNQRSHRSKLQRRGIKLSEKEFQYWWKKSTESSCTICGLASEKNTHGRLFLDHDHKTGKVRGLLCNRCNAAVGLLDEDLSRVRKVYLYLKEAA